MESSIFNRLDKNNLQNNSQYAICNLDSEIKVTNNWFGVTSVTQIASMISNNGGYSNFIPYRLFGEFNIEEGADTTNLSRITWATAYAINNDVILKWNKTSAGDFIRYNIYRTTNTTLWSNLTYNDVWTQTSPVSATNITNYNLPSATYYYYITAMDDAIPPAGSTYTNECWYSPGASVLVLATNPGPYFVDDTIGDDSKLGTFDEPFKTIQKAAYTMMPGVTVASCYIFPGTYSETVEIYSNQNSGFMVFTALSNNKSPIMTGSLTSNHGFFITNASSIIIRELKITKYIQGIIFSGIATNNYFIKNTIYSNDFYGIWINSDTADNNYILSNKIWGHDHDAGIAIQDGDTNKIYRNLIYHNKLYGIGILGTALNTEIINNTIFKNGAEDGIRWQDSSCGVVYNNIILSNGDGAGGDDYGIERAPAATGTIYVAYNDIYGNSDGPTN